VALHDVGGGDLSAQAGTRNARLSRNQKTVVAPWFRRVTDHGQTVVAVLETGRLKQRFRTTASIHVFEWRIGSQRIATCAIASPPLTTAIQVPISAAKKGKTILVRHCYTRDGSQLNRIKRTGVSGKSLKVQL
jgi:hypothetical protein